MSTIPNKIKKKQTNQVNIGKCVFYKEKNRQQQRTVNKIWTISAIIRTILKHTWCLANGNEYLKK